MVPRSLYPEDGTWSVSDGKLTLKDGFSFATSNAVAFDSSDVTELMLEGNSEVTSSFLEYGASFGISVGSGDLTISGSGTLTATGGAATNSYGMHTRNEESGSIIISGGTVLAKGNSAALKSNTFESYTVPTVSLDIDGSPTVSFDKKSLSTYKYLHIANVTPPASGPTYSGSVTVYNDPLQSDATVWLTGAGLTAGDLLITERDPSCSAYQALLKLADSDDVFATYNIHLKSGRKSTGFAMRLTFDLGAQYAGQDFTLVHQKADGTYEYFYGTADANGDISFGPLYELSPFMLVKGRLAQTAFTSLTDAPKTGDSAQTALWAGAALIIAAALAGTALCRRRRDY